MRIYAAALTLAVSAAMPAGASEGGKALIEPVRSIPVDDVWSGAPVGFQLSTRGSRQYVAYYSAERQMVIACRDLDSETWTCQKLEDKVGWDSHNSITFAFDSEGHIHLSGNMHGVPLRYYRTTTPGDITSLVRVESMTGEREQRVTYPRFGRSPEGELLFSYRDGGSGNGSEIVNIYDVKARKWSRFVEKPLFDGEGKVNAYYTGPARDGKGAYHLAWVWRDTGDCSTNHDVSYAMSSTFRGDFRKSDGAPLPLPLTMSNSEVVDPVPVKGGLLNRVRLSFDSQDRVMLTYNKFDAEGNTQFYTARREESGWVIYPTTNWKHRWDFSGGGTIPELMSWSGPAPWKPGTLYQVFTNKFESPFEHVRFLDERTLRQVGEPVRLFSPEFDTPSAKHTEDWRVNVAGFSISALARDGRAWAIKWESAGPNRDQPRDSVPPPSKLEVVELRIRQ